MAEQNLITAEELRARISYDPATGLFTWRTRPIEKHIDKMWNHKYAGSIAGSKNINGYIIIGLNNKLYQSHRLAFLYMTGRWPHHMIDHIDGVKDNNAWENLREATAVENCRNAKHHFRKHNIYKGVSKRGKKWIAQVSSKETGMKRFGPFDTPEEAREVYLIEAKKLYGEFARLS